MPKVNQSDIRIRMDRAYVLAGQEPFLECLETQIG